MRNINYPASVVEMGEAQAMARTLGLEFATAEIRRAEEIPPAIEVLRSRADALCVCADPLLLANGLRISISALGERLPTIHALRDFADAGGLISYGPNFPDLWRRCRDYVNKNLPGTKPGDIPVEQPAKFELVINLIVATALRIEIPPALLARADAVIE